MKHELNKFLKKYKHEIELLANGKVKCLVSGHEMSKDLQLLQKHWNGNKYKKCKAKACVVSVNLDDYEYIIPHKFLSSMCFCLLTKDTLNRDQKEIQNHIKGRRYQKKLAEKMKKLRKQEQHRLEREAAKARKEERQRQYNNQKVAVNISDRHIDDEFDFWVPPDSDEEQKVSDADDAHDGGPHTHHQQKKRPRHKYNSNSSSNTHNSKKRRPSRHGDDDDDDAARKQATASGSLEHDDGSNDFEVVPMSSEATQPNDQTTTYDHDTKYDTAESWNRSSNQPHSTLQDEATAVKEAMASLAAVEDRMEKSGALKKKKKKKKRKKPRTSNSKN